MFILSFNLSDLVVKVLSPILCVKTRAFHLSCLYLDVVQPVGRRIERQQLLEVEKPSLQNSSTAKIERFDGLIIELTLSSYYKTLQQQKPRSC